MFQPVYLDVIFSIFSISIVPLIKNEFMVYKGLINPKTAQKYEDYGIMVGFNISQKRARTFLCKLLLKSKKI